jgi:N-acetylmuramoyl-L-alanine amidase
MGSDLKRSFFALGALLLAVSSARAQGVLTVIHPAENQSLPFIKDVFVFGEVTPGSTVTINGIPIRVHPKGGYLAMAPLIMGPVTLTVEATTPAGEKIKVDRHVTVGQPYTELPAKPLALVKESLEPGEDLLLAPGDPLRVSFQASPQASAEFSLEGLVKHVPMAPRLLANSTETTRGVYEGNYIIQPGDKADQLKAEVLLKAHGKQIRAKTRGRLTIDDGAIPRTGVVVEDVAAVRTGPEGGYDLFLYRGMRVRLTGKVKNQRRVRLSSVQSGWVKDSAIQELAKGTPAPRSYLNNIIMARQEDSTLIRVPLDDVLPYRVEQSVDPIQLVITLYGAVDKTDLIRYDPADPLIRQVRWRQIAPDTCQIIVEPKFKKWWGYDVRYEGTSLMIEVRQPWVRPNVKGMTIALDAGHGGSELGATGPHGTLEKDANLAIARVVRDALEAEGARVVMTRNSDMEVPLYERSRIAWRNRAHLFISIHCNASGVWENPTINNGHSSYWYHPQSAEFARAIHAEYVKHSGLPDRGLFYSDFAVCRMTQMPATLIEQAYIIVPEQEQMIFDLKFQKTAAQSILDGILAFLQPK